MPADVIATHHGYPCRYTPTPEDGPVVRWGTDRAGVTASRDGVMVNGPVGLLDADGVAALRALLELAGTVAFRLRALERSPLGLAGLLADMADDTDH